MTERDVVFTIFTDSMELYQSRLAELRTQFGDYTRDDAIRDYHRYLMGIATDFMLELTYPERKRVHNLKYFTWIEQQGKEVDELNAQWYDYPEYWTRIQEQMPQIDALIESFNSELEVTN